jgi:hypothetical protein
MIDLIAARLVPMLLQEKPSNPNQLSADQQFEIARLALSGGGNAVHGVLALLVPFALFATILVLAWLFLRHRRSQIQARAEFQKQVMDKFASGREFAEFLGSAASQRFLDVLGSRGPKEQILSSMRTGVVLAVLGLGLLVLSLAKRGFLIPGVLALALGAGFLIATAISYRLSKQWEQNQEPRQPAAAS